MSRQNLLQHCKMPAIIMPCYFDMPGIIMPCQPDWCCLDM